MDKSIEIDGRVIYVCSKTIEINGSPVITQGEITIINQLNQNVAHTRDQQNHNLAHEQEIHATSL